MTDQKDFDFEGEAYARRTDPEESQGAATAMREEGGASALELVFLKALLEVHPEGLSSHGVCRASGYGYGSISPRIKPLRRRGLIEGHVDGDGKPIRVYDSKQPSRVWFLTAKGLEEVGK